MAKTFQEFGIKNVPLNSNGDIKTLCPVCSSTRTKKNEPCLSVNPSKGIWKCHHCGWAGSLNRGVYEKPIARDISYAPTKIIPLHTDFLTKRGITTEVIERNKISTQRSNMIAFPYFIGEKVYNIKFRGPQKRFQMVKDAPIIFYKLNDVFDEGVCIITEGELDALSCEVAGYRNAISVPNGAPNENESQNPTKRYSYLFSCMDYLSHVTKIILFTDNDIPGRRLKEELARRLGKEKCWLVAHPEGCKDANEVLEKFGANKLKEIIDEAAPYPIKGIYTAQDSFDEYMDLYDNGFPGAATTGYPLFDEHFKFYPGQLTIITGAPTHGKSNFIDQVIMRLVARQPYKIAMFSPENSSVAIHSQRFAEILTGKPFLPDFNNRMTREEAIGCTGYLYERVFHIIPDNEEYTVENILAAAKYLVFKQGVDMLVIDPWNTIEHQYKKDSQTDYVGKVLNKLKYFARLHSIHVVLVAHPTKMPKVIGRDYYEVPTPYSISGSANFFNVPDNCITIYRHFPNSGSDQNISSGYTQVYIFKVKHKFIGKQGTVRFAYDIACQRYTEFVNRIPTHLDREPLL